MLIRRFRRTCASCGSLCLFLVVASTMMFVPIVAMGNSLTTIQTTYTFNQPNIHSVKIDDQIFDQISMPGAPNSGQIGRPALPSCAAKIVLPYGMDVEKIDLICGERVHLGSGYLIEPVGEPFPLSATPAELPPVVANPAIYSSNEIYPSNKYSMTGTQKFRGYSVLILQLFPVEYIPASGDLYYCPNMKVQVECRDVAASYPLLRQSSEDRDEISVWVDNPADVSTYLNKGTPASRGYDMLIITTSALASAFQPLKDFHDSTGVATEIHTITEIGASDPHSIRDFIRQEYLNSGIQYVIIGGDDDVIPALDMYVVSWDRPDAVVEYDLPGDIYFSCLDGTYNYDGDSRWGEPTDGEGGGDIDLLADVNVGRFSANSVAEVTNLVNKTLAYAGSSDRSLQNVLVAGEQLRFGGLGEYGGYAMDEMFDYSDAHGYLTFGFPTSEYDVEKLYDLLALPNNYWPASAMISRINAGLQIVDHLGHSGPGYAMRTDTTMLRQQLTNTQYFFVYAEGCSAGEFDRTDCWAEYMTTILSHGAFGCIANSRLGLGSRSTAHPVHVFDREFWDAIYNGEEAKPQLGRALSDARADHIYHINDPGIRWNFYEINLFGDPAVAIKSVNSVQVSFPDGLPERISPMAETTFDVLATGIGGGLPLSGSGRLHFAIDDGNVETIDMSETSPNLYQATLPSVACGQTIRFYTSVQDTAGQVYYAPDTALPVQLSPVADSMILFEDDFETDMGWSASGGLWARGVPTGQGGTEEDYPVPDPTEGCSGPNVMGYNLSGDYENNLPATYVTSPAIDCSGANNVYLKFCRWLGVERPNYDKASISASIDGINWTQVWENPATIADLEWNDMDYDISDVAAGQPTVYLRWTMGPTDGGLRYIGWNIDDVRVISYGCESIVYGDANADGNVNVADAVYIIAYIFKGGPPPNPFDAGDANCDTAVNVADAVYVINYIFKGGPAPGC